MPRKPLFHRLISQDRGSTRRGFSLLELVAATALMGITLVSALELMRDGMELSTETDQRQLIASYGASQLEERMAMVADSWTTGSFSGDYIADGWGNIRYLTNCSDNAVDGGISNFLMDIKTTVYLDVDSDDALDADELSCTYHTKIGKFTTYEELIP